MLGKEWEITVRSRDDPLADEGAIAVQHKTSVADAITALRLLNHQNVMRDSPSAKYYIPAAGQFTTKSRCPAVQQLLCYLCFRSQSPPCGLSKCAGWAQKKVAINYRQSAGGEMKVMTVEIQQPGTSFEPAIFRLGVSQNRHIRVSIFPDREEFLIFLLGSLIIS